MLLKSKGLLCGNSRPHCRIRDIAQAKYPARQNEVSTRLKKPGDSELPRNLKQIIISTCGADSKEFRRWAVWSFRENSDSPRNRQHGKKNSAAAAEPFFFATNCNDMFKTDKPQCTSEEFEKSEAAAGPRRPRLASEAIPSPPRPEFLKRLEILFLLRQRKT